MYYIVYALLYVISLLPLRLLYTLFAPVRLFMRNYRRDVIVQNLSRSFPSEKYNRIKEQRKEYSKNFADFFPELLKVFSASAGSLGKRIEIENADLVRRYQEQGRQIIVCMGHCGNYEMLNIVAARKEKMKNVYVIYKPLHSKLADRILKHVRERFDTRYIPTWEARECLKELPGIYVFGSDQHASAKKTNDIYRFEFLNQRAAFFPGIEILAREVNAVVIYKKILRTGRGHYKISFNVVSDDVAQLQEGEVLRRYAALLEQNIYEQPSVWLWSHKRWK
ncbi:MAG: lysophospholipid acyltransferase family protein [Bacteroidales bacterium]|jgi:KDO2-lipid IV(A) lauroyltransferase|nr:lysophospholipid acyltransferase family protein [Bacteroidales bacterium]